MTRTYLLCFIFFSLFRIFFLWFIWFIWFIHSGFIFSVFNIVFRFSFVTVIFFCRFCCLKYVKKICVYSVCICIVSIDIYNAFEMKLVSFNVSRIFSISSVSNSFSSSSCLSFSFFLSLITSQILSMILFESIDLESLDCVGSLLWIMPISIGDDGDNGSLSFFFGDYIHKQYNSKHPKETYNGLIFFFLIFISWIRTYWFLYTAHFLL